MFSLRNQKQQIAQSAFNTLAKRKLKFCILYSYKYKAKAWEDGNANREIF